MRRFARAADPDQLVAHDGTGRRASGLDDHRGYLLHRWNAGWTDAVALTQEIRARGYRGSYVLVHIFLAAEV